MKYLGKTHNLWHRMTLNLEQMAIDQASGRVPKEIDIYDYDVETTTSTVSFINYKCLSITSIPWGSIDANAKPRFLWKAKKQNYFEN